ncbi:hypothetical protein [Bacillus changyiensis]|uniref:hypothetical protein n=1 Tax=Bacillus changyiensis TaxID=3004103 RepID=UPI0022E738EF|nr:hypothetical protein [Bacillus changyiensis]MDA1475602.1 hypothetical protein [Bacillus changyiensis]
MGKKLLVGLASVVLIYIAQIGQAKGAELKTIIHPTSKEVKLDWNDTGDRYEVYSAGKLVWKGTKSKYVQRNLKSVSPQDFNIVSYKDGKRVDSLNIDTMTLPENRAKVNSAYDENMPDPLKSDVYIDSTINDHVLSLKLRGNIQDDFDGKIEIYKDEKLIDNNAGTKLVDDNIEPGKTYVYKFVATKRLSESEIKKVNEEFKNTGQALSFDKIKDYYYRPYEYIKAIRVPKQNERVNNPAWEPPVGPHPNQIGIKYRTFIPNKYVRASSLVSGWTKSYKFGGDNRSFSFSRGSHRTQTEAVARFWSTGSETFFKKSVGYTRLYTKKGEFIKKKRASAKDITFSQGARDKKMNYFVIHHNTKVAFNDFGWASPGITYGTGIVAHKNGRVTVSGTRDQAPNHEMYAYIPYSDVMIPLFKAKNKGFEYLAPPMPNAYININVKF